MHSLLGKGNVLFHTKALDSVRSGDFVKVFRGCVQVNNDLSKRVDNDRNIRVDVRPLTHLSLIHILFWSEPWVRNWNTGPRALVIAVRIGDMTSSASFMVGAVVIWWVVLVSTFSKND